MIICGEYFCYLHVLSSIPTPDKHASPPPPQNKKKYGADFWVAPQLVIKFTGTLQTLQPRVPGLLSMCTKVLREVLKKTKQFYYCLRSFHNWIWTVWGESCDPCSFSFSWNKFRPSSGEIFGGTRGFKIITTTTKNDWLNSFPTWHLTLCGKSLDPYSLSCS